MATALKQKDETLFAAQWREDGYGRNLVGGSGVSGQELFNEGSRKGWFLKPDPAALRDAHGDSALIPCQVCAFATNRVVDEVYTAVVRQDDQWMALGVGEAREQVEALLVRYAAGAGQGNR